MAYMSGVPGSCKGSLRQGVEGPRLATELSGSPGFGSLPTSGCCYTYDICIYTYIFIFMYTCGYIMIYIYIYTHTR